ncbi:GDSL-type esterase/lipase family protein [Micromonospora sp. CPCC 205561]|uniref:GDSL-type esterase/lipase family protein n=1 Tax=Micromonospora sp. CPCC 205561 TaxID=3122407 RepID=UPI002FF186C3
MLSDCLVGHADIEIGRHGGIVPLRLPAWADRQHDRADLRWAARNPAGVRLRMRTAARTVTITSHATVVDDGRAAVPRLVVFDGGPGSVHDIPRPSALRIGPDDAGGVRVVGIDPGDPYHLTIDRDGTEGLLEVLLPHNCQIELLGLAADGPVVPAGPERGPVWVHYGSSISHGNDAEQPHQPWPVQVARRHGWDLRNLSFSGNATLDPFAGRVAGTMPADLVTAKVGINVVNADCMRAPMFRTALHGFVDSVRERLPRTPIVLFSAVSCPMHEDTPGPVRYTGGRFVPARRDVEGERDALTLSVSRRIVEDVVRARQSADPHLFHVDGRALLGPDDTGTLFDGLHPDQSGTDLIAARFVDALPPGVRAAVQPNTSADR